MLRRSRTSLALALVGVFALFLSTSPMMADTTNSPAVQTADAYLAGGCFWCVEAAYDLLPGVVAVESGYAGGTVADPTYKEVCTGTTGHAEVVHISYDPSKISYKDLLEFFWVSHDPTTLNRQGADVGTQYRSSIMYVNDEQKKEAEESKAEAQAEFKDPIVTEIVPLKTFYKAEDYHQDYFALNPNQPYCSAVIGPKIRKLKAKLEKEHGTEVH